MQIQIYTKYVNVYMLVYVCIYREYQGCVCVAVGTYAYSYLFTLTYKYLRDVYQRVYISLCVRIQKGPMVCL